MEIEADLSAMYTEIRGCMAVDFIQEFGPEIFQEPEKELQDMNCEEYASLVCHFSCFVLSDRAVTYKNCLPRRQIRDNPRDKTLHVKGGGGLSFAPYRRVTLLRGSSYLHAK